MAHRRRARRGGCGGSGDGGGGDSGGGGSYQLEADGAAQAAAVSPGLPGYSVGCLYFSDFSIME